MDRSGHVSHPSKKMKQNCPDQCNAPSCTSTSLYNSINAPSCTTCTTNMYNEDRCDVPAQLVFRAGDVIFQPLLVQPLALGLELFHALQRLFVPPLHVLHPPLVHTVVQRQRHLQLLVRVLQHRFEMSATHMVGNKRSYDSKKSIISVLCTLKGTLKSALKSTLNGTLKSAKLLVDEED